MQSKVVEGVFYGKIGNKYLDGWNLKIHVCTTDDLSDYIFYSDSMIDEFENPTKHINKSFVPKPGDEIYLGPNCPYAVADVRKNYKLKRRIDEGVCNVISPRKDAKYVWQRYCTEYYIDEAWRTLYLNTVTNYPLSVAFELPVWVNDKVKKVVPYYALTIYGIKSTGADRAILEGTKKPTILISQLPLKKENSLTMDTLSLVIRTGNEVGFYSSAKDNFFIQLQALNQTNWMEYQGTLSVLFHGILDRMCDGRRVCSLITCKSKLPKAVQEMVTSSREGYKPFVSQADVYMASELLNSQFDKPIPLYLKLSDLAKNIVKKDIDFGAIYHVYDPVVRMLPKKIENEQKDSI